MQLTPQSRTKIIPGPIPSYASDNSKTSDGAELVFHGRVRKEEHGREITHLDYEYYEGMAEQELERLASRALESFKINDLYCEHRVGKVPVGEAAIRVTIWSKHREEGLKALGWFIDTLKKDVPIWKWAVTEDGERYPAVCSHN